MSDEVEVLAGLIVKPQELQGQKAKELALLLGSGRLPFVELVECRAAPDSWREIVKLNIQVEVSQRPVKDIRRVEPIAVILDKQDNVMPEVLALRTDFPQVPHLNLKTQEYLRSLCLFDQPYDEVRLRWTPTQFLVRLAIWLRDTAEGTLHRKDQPLEPLLMPDDPYTLIIHPSVFKEEDATYLSPVSVRPVQNDSKWPVDFITSEGRSSAATHLLTVILVPPQTHGIITRIPEDLHELDVLLQTAGLGLVMGLRELLAQPRKVLGAQKSRPKDMGVIFLVVFQKKRTDEDEPEALEFRAFLCEDANVFRIREELGVSGRPSQPKSPRARGDGSNIKLRSANCIFICTRDKLNILSGVEKCIQTKLTCVGAGALGSQVVLNLVRMGFGMWTIVDSDILLPHNIARHALNPSDTGKWKAKSMADLVNSILQESAAKGIPANVLNPDAHRDDIENAFSASDVIVDMSTSVAVSRWLATDVSAPARRISMFLNPSGTDLVLLAEDKDRKVTLDRLEMQYYRHLICRSDRYVNHLGVQGEGIRYGNSCRDVSSRIPQDAIAALSGIGSRAIRLALASDQAKIVIWKSDEPWFGITADEVSVQDVAKSKSGDWTIVTDRQVFTKALEFRAGKLPKETGGILVGSFDAQRKMLYVVDLLPAPPDSKEDRSSFVRGTEGVSEKRQEISDISAGWLDYVGEWHSHPEGCGCNRSPDDCRQCVWIADYMQVEGLPGLMLIVSDSEYMFYLQHVVQD